MKVPSEAELAKDVMGWLAEGGWSLYQEVLLPGGAADIVATRGPIVSIVECKRHLGVDVLEQCYRWLPDAHFVWAACWRGTSRSTRLLTRMAEDFGIGVVTFSARYRETNDEREDVRARFRRAPPGIAALRARLAPEHQSGYQEAGTNRGRRWTPYQQTLAELRRVARDTPGISLKAAIDSIKHHYSSSGSALGSLRHWLGEGKAEGLRLERDGKTTRLFAFENYR